MKRSILFPIILLFIFKVGMGSNIPAHGEQSKENTLQAVHKHQFTGRSLLWQAARDSYTNKILKLSTQITKKDAIHFFSTGVTQNVMAKAWAWLIMTLLAVFCWAMLGLFGTSGFFGTIGIFAGYVFYLIAVFFLIFGMIRFFQILGGDA